MFCSRFSLHVLCFAISNIAHEWYKQTQSTYLIGQMTLDKTKQGISKCKSTKLILELKARTDDLEEWESIANHFSKHTQLIQLKLRYVLPRVCCKRCQFICIDADDPWTMANLPPTYLSVLECVGPWLAIVWYTRTFKFIDSSMYIWEWFLSSE